jgi:hypothetical protein
MNVLVTNCAMRDRSEPRHDEGPRAGSRGETDLQSLRHWRAAAPACSGTRESSSRINRSSCRRRLMSSTDAKHVLAAALPLILMFRRYLFSRSWNYWFDGPVRLSRVRRFTYRKPRGRAVMYSSCGTSWITCRTCGIYSQGLS